MAPKWETALFDEHPEWLAALGLLPDSVAVVAFGENADVDTGTDPETLWAGGGLYPWQAAAYSAEIVSGDAADAAAGTGARTVLVEGLDGVTMLPKTEVATLNGTTPVALTGTWWRIHKATVVTAGSGGTNAGAITVRLASAGATQAVVPLGRGQSAQATYTVPAGYTGMLLRINAGLLTDAAGSTVRLGLFTRSGGATRQVATLVLHQTGPGEITRPYPIPLAFAALTDLELRVIEVSDDNTGVHGDFSILAVA